MLVGKDMCCGTYLPGGKGVSQSGGMRSTVEVELRERVPVMLDRLKLETGLTWYGMAKKLGTPYERLCQYRWGRRTPNKLQMVQLIRLAYEGGIGETIVRGLLEGWDSHGQSNGGGSSRPSSSRVRGLTPEEFFSRFTRRTPTRR